MVHTRTSTDIPPLAAQPDLNLTPAPSRVPYFSAHYSVPQEIQKIKASSKDRAVDRVDQRFLEYSANYKYDRTSLKSKTHLCKLFSVSCKKREDTKMPWNLKK